MRLAPLVLGLLVVGCYDLHVTPNECSVHCGSAGCPSGFSCRQDGFCHAGSPDQAITLCPLAGGGSDAAPADAAPATADAPETTDAEPPDATPPVEGFPPCPDPAEDGGALCVRTFEIGPAHFNVLLTVGAGGRPVVASTFVEDLKIGDFNEHSAGSVDVFVLRFDPDLVPTGISTISGDDDDEISSIVADPGSDTVFLNGTFDSSALHLGTATALPVPSDEGSPTQFIAAVRAASPWIVATTDIAHPYYSMLPTSDGDLLVAAGYYKDAVIGEVSLPEPQHLAPPDYLYQTVIARLAKDTGEVLWHTQITTAGAPARGDGAAAAYPAQLPDPDDPGNVILFTDFRGTVTFDGGATTVTSGNGGHNFSVLLLGYDLASGTVRWHRQLDSDVENLEYRGPEIATGGKIVFGVSGASSLVLLEYAAGEIRQVHTVTGTFGAQLLPDGDQPILATRCFETATIDNAQHDCPSDTLVNLFGLAPAGLGFAWYEEDLRTDGDACYFLDGLARLPDGPLLAAGCQRGRVILGDDVLLDATTAIPEYLLRFDPRRQNAQRPVIIAP